VEGTLRVLGLEELRGRRPGALSGGERQRVALARAIACDAEILLLDEPLGSLDAQTRNRVRGELLRLLRVVGRIAIMVTHDYIDALTFGDRICVLDRGKVLQIGERQEFGRFAVSATPFDPPKGPVEAGLPGVIRTDEFHAPNLPSPQDWVLVLERVKP
jgi:multiple sugar transport system ATP-binding protein